MINITVNDERELSSDIYTIGNEGDCGIEQFTIETPKSYNNVEFSELHAYLLGRFSSGENEKISLGVPQIGETQLTYTIDIPETLYCTSGNLTLSVCIEKEDGSIYWSSNPNNGFKVLQSIVSDGEIAQKYPTILQTINTKINEDIPESLDLKVDKVSGKSLISDTEIERLAGITSTDGLSEGNTNLYHTTARVNNAINAQKGQPNGLATLNENGMVAQNGIYSYESGEANTAKSGSALETAINNRIVKNANITGGTKTKITYDEKGLVTSGADATTADIAESADKRYCTDSQKSDIATIGSKGAKVAEIITSNNATSVVFGNLDILADGSFYHVYIIGSNGTQKTLFMTINGQETAGDYRTGTSIGSPSSNPTIATLGEYLTFCEIDIGLKRANSKTCALSRYGSFSGSNIGVTSIRLWWYESTNETNVTSIKFVTSDGSAFADNMKFELYKMGVA